VSSLFYNSRSLFSFGHFFSNFFLYQLFVSQYINFWYFLYYLLSFLKIFAYNLGFYIYLFKLLCLLFKFLYLFSRNYYFGFSYLLLRFLNLLLSDLLKQLDRSTDCYDTSLDFISFNMVLFQFYKVYFFCYNFLLVLVCFSFSFLSSSNGGSHNEYI